jgi:hypothetical protein
MSRSSEFSHGCGPEIISGAGQTARKKSGAKTSESAKINFTHRDGGKSSGKLKMFSAHLSALRKPPTIYTGIS